MAEKQAPLLPAGAAPQPRRKSFWSRHVPLTSLIALTALYYGFVAISSFEFPPLHAPGRHCPHAPADGKCVQVDPLLPSSSPETADALEDMEKYIVSDAFRNETVRNLAGAIQIPSISYDDLGPIGEDPRWEVMYDIAAYLERTFPLVHERLHLEKVNTHGLLYTWEGSDPSLKPTVLMAHQDVVPVAEATADQWTHPPFSGAYDGEFVWGRGASDCKNTLIGSLEAVELLLGAGFEPRRTVVLSFGFDEEISGGEGARTLSAAVLERYGRDGVASVVDEGSGLQEKWGTVFALPGVAEKGYVDIEIAVRTPGGHSSVPPPHTGIGILAEVLTSIEAHPYKSHLAPENPFLELLQCGAAHADEFPSGLEKLLPGRGSRRGKKGKLEREAAKLGPETKFLFTTSAAVDVVSGGVKVNALPERAFALVNHRVNVGDTSEVVRSKLARLAGKVAKRHSLTLRAFDDDDDASEEVGSIILRAAGRTLEPAPVTPTVTEGTTAYSVLAGTTRGLYGEGVVVAPGLMTGNTDTRYYWDVSPNIFRFTPSWDPNHSPWGAIHTVDEKISVVGHVSAVQWYSRFIRNMDEADLE